MTRTITLSDDVFEALERFRRRLEVKLGRSISYEEALRVLLRQHYRIGKRSLEELAQKVEVLEKEVSEIKRKLGTSREFVTTRYKTKVQDKFVEFMKDVIVYPMERIRAPKDKVERLVHEGYFEVIYSSGKSYLVYKPKLEEFLRKLPLPKSKVKDLSREEQKLLEVLKGAALVYEDVATRSIRRV